MTFNSRDINPRYYVVQIGNTGLYVIIDADTGFRLTFFGAAMPPISRESAIALAKHYNDYANLDD